MNIEAKEIKLVDVDLLTPDPKNPNEHPEDQLELLSKMIQHKGFRNPITVSNRSGFIVCGHGRLEVAKRLGMKEVPVIYQDFKNEAEEYEHMNADNELGKWARTNFEKVNERMLELGPELNIELMAIKDFTLEPAEKTEDKEVELSFDYKIEVDCNDEMMQQSLMAELKDRGLKVRVLL